MRNNFILFLLLASITCRAQVDTAAKTNAAYKVYERHSFIPTVSLGFIDNYKQHYSLPAGFEKGNTSGFTPFYAKLEYCLYKHIGIAATFGYDAFYYNYKQYYLGNNGLFFRYRTDNVRIFSGGLTAFYHLNALIHVNHLDPFIGVGVAINNIRYSAYPQGDTTTIKFDHTVTPYLKVGARYYLSSRFSIFGDAGYDQQSILSLGFSCRFFHRNAVTH